MSEPLPVGKGCRRQAKDVMTLANAHPPADDSDDASDSNIDDGSDDDKEKQMVSVHVMLIIIPNLLTVHY